MQSQESLLMTPAERNSFWIIWRFSNTRLMIYPFWYCENRSEIDSKEDFAKTDRQMRQVFQPPKSFHHLSDLGEIPKHRVSWDVRKSNLQCLEETHRLRNLLILNCMALHQRVLFIDNHCLDEIWPGRTIRTKPCTLHAKHQFILLSFKPSLALNSSDKKDKSIKRSLKTNEETVEDVKDLLWN